MKVQASMFLHLFEPSSFIHTTPKMENVMIDEKVQLKRISPYFVIYYSNMKNLYVHFNDEVIKQTALELIDTVDDKKSKKIYGFMEIVIMEFLEI